MNNYDELRGRGPLPVHSPELERRIDRLIAVMERHPEPLYKSSILRFTAASGLAAGATLVVTGLAQNPPSTDVPFLDTGMNARSLVIDNPSGYRLLIPQLMRSVPAGALNYVLGCHTALNKLSVIVVEGTSAVAEDVTIVGTEERLAPSPAVANSAAAGANVAITSPIGQALMAASVAVVIASNQSAVAISAASLPLPTNAAQETGGNLATLASIVAAGKGAIKAAANDIVDLATLLGRVPTALTGAGWFQVSPRGAANLVTSQVTSTAAAATLIIARPTRARCTIRNGDAANSVWYGPATVTTGNGFILKAGESKDITWPGLLQVIDSGAHALIYISDEFD